jgi:UDP-N-acetylbacillosamine N-acetyltransferase
MKSPLVLVGSGRLAFQVAELILQSAGCEGYEALSYCRYAPESSPTPFQRIFSLPRKFSYVVAVGNPSQRRDEAKAVARIGLSSTPFNVISSSCYVAGSSIIAKNSGIIALPRATISTGAHIGQFALVGSGAIIEHDCNIGEFCTIGPGAVICGAVKVGNTAFIGANATVIQSISIGSSAVIGAGAVVVREVEHGFLGIGNPCKTTKRPEPDCNPL